MTDEQTMVQDFHRKFEILVQTAPANPTDETKQLRIRLIQEEFDELKESMAAGNPRRFRGPAPPPAGAALQRPGAAARQACGSDLRRNVEEVDEDEEQDEEAGHGRDSPHDIGDGNTVELASGRHRRLLLSVAAGRRREASRRKSA